MNNLIQKINKMTRELGYFATALYAMDRVLNKLSNRVNIYYYLFVRQDTNWSSGLPPLKGSSFQFQQFTLNNAILESLPRPEEVIQQRFNRGYICLTATKNNEFVGCAWLSLGPYLEDEVRARFVPQPEGNVAWDFDVYIVPAQRIGYLFPRLWENVNLYLMSHGYSATVSRISGFNAQSLNSHKKLGAETIGKAVFIKLLGIQISFCTLYPYCHVSLNVDSIPEYKLGSQNIKNN